jgi:peroxiredoxin
MVCAEHTLDCQRMSTGLHPLRWKVAARVAMVLTPSKICNFGWKARDFALQGVDGRTYSLAEVRGSKGTLLAFICNHCPYVQAIVGRLVAEAKALREVGIGTIAIMPNDTAAYPQDSFDNMKLFAAQHGFTFPYVIDATQEVAKTYGALCTPDFFGFNAQDELQYRGRLDVSRTSLVPNARRDLYEAMRPVAQTGRGPDEQLPSMGCSIKWRQ